MAKDKKAFVLYCDLIQNIDHLTITEKGVLFNHLLEYVNDMNPVLTDRVVLSAWKPIERQLKRDLKKFEEVKAKRSLAGKKSAELRALKKTEQNLTNPTSVESDEHTSTNSTVKDTVKVTDTVKVSTYVDVDSFYNVDILKNHYLENGKVVNAIISNKDNGLGSKKQLENRLTEFNEHIKQQGRLSENFKEYSKYFLNWNRKKKEIETRGKSKVTVSEWAENPYKNS